MAEAIAAAPRQATGGYEDAVIRKFVIATTFWGVVAFLVVWARFSFPRFREDQLQRLAWKFMIPLALVNIAATAVLKVVF